MKTAEEWFKNWSLGDLPNILEMIKAAQSDAFHAGKMEGIKEAQEIVRCHANQFNVAVVKAVDSMDSK